MSMPDSNTKNVLLTDEDAAQVEQLVESGRYSSVNEVIRDGLRSLKREEETRLIEKWLIEGQTPDDSSSYWPGLADQVRESLRAKVQKSLDEARRGELIDGEEYFARWTTLVEDAHSESNQPGE
jgi:putative addiction module CopG family antidote